MTAELSEQPLTWLDRLRRIYGNEPSLAYAVAERLFSAHNSSKGALMPGGFGFLRPDQQAPWITRAERLLARDQLTNQDGAGVSHSHGDAL